MKNRLLLLSIALIVLFVFSCNKAGVSTETVVVDLGDNRVDNLSKLFEVVDLVKLEEADDALFRTITQLKVVDNKVYILDLISNKILCFNIDGTFNRVLCAAGQGPGEYTQLTSFDIDSQSGSLIVTDADVKTIVYDLDTFRFRREMKSSIGYTICCMQDKLLGFNYVKLEHNETRYDGHIVMADTLLNVERDALPISYESGYVMFPACRFYKYNESVCTFPPFDDQIYEWKDQTFTPKYTLSFGGKDVFKAQGLEAKESNYNYLKDLREGNEIWGINPVETKGNLIVSYWCGNDSYVGVYDKATQTASSYPFANPSEYQLLSNIHHSYNDELVAVVGLNVLDNATILSAYHDSSLDDGFFVVRLKTMHNR